MRLSVEHFGLKRVKIYTFFLKVKKKRFLYQNSFKIIKKIKIMKKLISHYVSISHDPLFYFL